MNIISSFFSLLFHLWFYFCNLLVILLILPFIFVSSLRSEGYRYFFMYERWWAKMVLFLCGFVPKVDWQGEKPDKNGQYIICTNHTSMVDIMLTLAVFPNPFLFIGKKELASMPLFGYFYKRTNILVDRSSLSSRKQVFQKSAAKLDEGLGLCIYPEGLAPREEITLAPFKMGAFRLSAEKGVTIIPATYLDCKEKFPFNFFKGYPGRLRVVVHPFLKPRENNPAEAERLKEECYRIILQPLQTEALGYEIN